MAVLSVFLCLLALYGATISTPPDVLDGEVEFQTTSSLVRRGSLALGGTPEAEAILAHDGGRGFNTHRGGPGREHESFSWFGVGQAYTGVPFYLMGRALQRLFPEFEERHAAVLHLGIARSEYFEHLCVGLRNPLLGAWTAALVTASALLLAVRQRTAWIAGLAYGLCTFAWPQARSTFNSVQTTFFLFAALYCVLLVRDRLARGLRPGIPALLAASASLGMAFLTRSLSGPAIAVVGMAALWVLWSEKRRKARLLGALELAALGAPALGALGLFLWTNAARFGAPLEQGYGGIVTWESYFNYPLHFGLAGILFSPGQGLLWMAPLVVLVLPWSWRSLRRREVFLPALLLAVAGAVLVPVAMTVGWHGAWGYGPRYALPLLPFLWLGVAQSLEALETERSGPEDPVLGRRIGKGIALALGLLGLVVALGGVLVDTTTHLALAVEAARLEWPDIPGKTEEDREEERFQRIRTDLRFAAPWAHWRIFFHRATGRAVGRAEAFPLREIFLLERDDVLTLPEDRDHGFRHLAWIDFRERLGGSFAPVAVLGAALLAGAAACARRGFGQGDSRKSVPAPPSSA